MSARTRVVVFSPERVSEFWSDVVGVGSDLEDEGGIGSMWALRLDVAVGS